MQGMSVLTQGTKSKAIFGNLKQFYLGNLYYIQYFLNKNYSTGLALNSRTLLFPFLQITEEQVVCCFGNHHVA